MTNLMFVNFGYRLKILQKLLPKLENHRQGAVNINNNITTPFPNWPSTVWLIGVAMKMEFLQMKMFFCKGIFNTNLPSLFDSHVIIGVEKLH